MAKRGFKVLDSAIHIMEPADLWERYLEPPYKGRVRGFYDFVEDMRLEIDGKVLPTVLVTEERLATREMARSEEVYRRYAEGGWTSKLQLEAMDEEGVDVAVIYPSRGLFAQAVDGMDPKLAAAMAVAYNNWLYDFCQEDPQRLLASGMVSPFGPEDAVVEARRCVKELGFKAIFLRPNLVNGRNWYDPYYEPLWTTLEELGVPLGFHESMGPLLPQVGERFGSNAMLRHTASHPFEQALAAIAFCGGGILERHPNLRVGFLEGNCSWVPFVLWRLDEHWERHGSVYAPELKMAPSEYFKRQCFVSIECDEEPAKYTIDWMGDDQIVFSTDFPHPDSKFPDSVDAFLRLPITDESKRKILWDNCASYYGLS